MHNKKSSFPTTKWTTQKFEEIKIFRKDIDFEIEKLKKEIGESRKKIEAEIYSCRRFLSQDVINGILKRRKELDDDVEKAEKLGRLLELLL